MKKFILAAATACLIIPGCTCSADLKRTKGEAAFASSERAGETKERKEYIPSERRFKYVVTAENGWVLGLYGDGRVVETPGRNATENNFEAMFSLWPHTIYRELDDTLILNSGEKIPMFLYNGNISWDFYVFDYSPVEYVNAVRDFEKYTGQVDPDSVYRVTKTALITLYPEQPEFEDEESQEALDYYEGVDDLLYYLYEIAVRFEELGVEAVNPQKRYLVFEVENGEQILIDTYAPQNGWTVHAFAYREGRTPLKVDIVDYDTYMKTYKRYFFK